MCHIPTRGPPGADCNHSGRGAARLHQACACVFSEFPGAAARRALFKSRGRFVFFFFTKLRRGQIEGVAGTIQRISARGAEVRGEWPGGETFNRSPAHSRDVDGGIMTDQNMTWKRASMLTGCCQTSPGGNHRGESGWRNSCPSSSGFRKKNHL